jgi:hypothetical protein
LKTTRLSFFFSGVLLLLAAAAIPRATSAATPAAGSTITLQNANSKLCVGTGGSTGFSYLIQTTCSTATSQQFTLKAAPASGWYYLASASSKYCWDVSGGSGSAGAQIQQYTCTAVWPEYFQLKPVSGGYELLSGNMAGGCVDIIGASTSSGAHLEQNGCTGVANQIFTASVVGSGTGTSQPQVSLSSTTLSFGTVLLGTTSTQTVKLTNSGTASLTVSNDTLSGTGFSISGLTFPLTLAAGQSTNFSVAFAPAASGSVSGSLSLVSNATNSPNALSLSGTGATATHLLTANPTGVSFGSVNMGSTGSSHVTLTNTGNSNVTISSVTSSSAGFTTSGVSGATTLTPSQSLTLNVAFAPTTAGSVTGTIAVVSSATNSPATVTLSGTGVSTSSGSSTIVNVISYGASGNGSTDDTAAINSAIAALAPGDTLEFPEGTYLVTSLHPISVSGVTIDGSNNTAKIISKTTQGGPFFTIGHGGLGQTGNVTCSGWPGAGSGAPLSATANEQSSTFSTNSALSGVSAGSYVLLLQGGEDSSGGSGNTTCDTSGCRGELVNISAVDGATYTVATTLHDTYSPSNSAIACPIPGMISRLILQNITLDGGSSTTQTTGNYWGVEFNDCADCTISGVTFQNALGAALLHSLSYGNTFSNITVTGAGSEGCGAAVQGYGNSNLTFKTMSLSNLNPGTNLGPCLSDGAFGLEEVELDNSTASNVTVNSAGTGGGRPMKITAARWNTYNSLTVENGTGNFNGLSLEYYSSHNTFNSCVVTNNSSNGGTGTGNAGIITFGNFNQYNSFNNCTVSGNGNVQFYISGYDALRLAQDSHNTVSGGTFTGSNSSEAVILIEGEAAYITGTTISGPGPQGIYLDTQATNACANNNTFKGNSSLGTAISANASGDLGLGNIFNLLTSNLTVGVCAPPLP